MGRPKMYTEQEKRARALKRAYDESDKRYNRGEGDLTPEWIVENIFSQPCAHCGKIGWNVIGCNRLDNTKPHNKDNVEPCCVDCNKKLASKEKSLKAYQYDNDNVLVKSWDSIKDCEKAGYNKRSIYKCFKGIVKRHRGYKWSKTPL